MADDCCRHMDRELMLPARQSRRRAKSFGGLTLGLVALLSTAACQADSQTFSPEDKGSPLRLERRIALPGVAGRIDHLAIDLPRHILFVAEYGNGTVEAVDIKSGRVLWRITGLHEVQGIAVTSNGQQVVVACGDGTVHFYATIDQHQVAALSLGYDADNIRIDQRNGHVVVGYGTGGLAVIDPSTHLLISRMQLPGHPEGFDLSGNGVIINVPDGGSILAGDLDSNRSIQSWPTGLYRRNFPMAIDPAGQWFAVAYRLPSALQLRDLSDGTIRATVGACGDADDLFVDGDRIYLICGAGYVDVVSAAHPKAGVLRVITSPGARTGLFVPVLKTLFVAAPAHSGTAAILMLHTN